MRARAGWLLCAAVLVAGLVAAALASDNRARGNELDRLERWCEAQVRRNELARAANQRAEWQLLGQKGAPLGGRSVGP